MQRYSKKEFPIYAFVPSVNAHPLKVGGHMFEQGEPHASKISPKNFMDHELYLYAIDLFNFGYFWECHAYLEAIWNAHARAGNEAQLCKGIIKVAAGLLKFKLNDPSNTRSHLERACEILESIDEKICLGIDIDDFVLRISHVLSELNKPLPQVSIQILLKP